ncbi:hypothetical protein D9M71_765330 [compost metagenome]
MAAGHGIQLAGLGQGFQHHQGRARGAKALQQGRVLGRAGEQQALGREARSQGRHQLAFGADVGAQPGVPQQAADAQRGIGLEGVVRHRARRQGAEQVGGLLADARQVVGEQRGAEALGGTGQGAIGGMI